MSSRIEFLLMLKVLLVISLSWAEGNSKPFKHYHIKMYMYDKITSPNATGVRVAGPNGDTTKTQFGSLFVIDNQIFDGPNFTTANQIGRAKGTFMIAAVETSHAFLVLSAVLQTSEYNGTLAMQGTDKSVGPQGMQEIAIVGGTGDFRMATGYANYTTVYLNIPDSVALHTAHVVVPTFE